MKRNGFTLIELLVVVAIIGILAAVGVVAYNGYTSSAKKTVAKQNHKMMVKEFSVSDGLFKFQFVKNKNNYIQGLSKTSFKLKTKKGLNIPDSFYNDDLQEKLYLEFINKAEKVQYDGIGLSFIQNGAILKKIRNILKNKVLVSKIENLYGLNKAAEISKNSDLIMIDRGDLLAEVGTGNLYKSICEISKQAHCFKKPLIMATENLESMQNFVR